MIVTDNREGFADYDASIKGLLCVTTLGNDLAFQENGIYIGTPVAQFTYKYSFYVGSLKFEMNGAAGPGMIVKDMVVGRLTGNFTNNEYEVRLFCPAWLQNGMPQYYVKINIGYTPAGFKFMTDVDALKTPRSVYRDYRSRDAFGFYFPHVDIDYKKMCYNQDFTSLGHWNVIQKYFGNKDWNLEYSEAIRTSNSGNAGQLTKYFGDEYNPLPAIKFMDGYYGLTVTSNYIRANIRAVWAGKYLKQNIGICYSITNNNPKPGDVGCEVFISKDSSNPFVFDWSWSKYGYSYENQIPVTPNKTYYIRPYLILEDDTLVLGDVREKTTPAIGRKPFLNGFNAIITDKTAKFIFRVFDSGDSDIISHGIRLGTRLDNMVDKVVDNSRWAAYRMFSAYITNLLPNTKYYIQAYATNSAGETVSSEYVTEVVNVNTSGYFVTSGQGKLPSIGSSLVMNITPKEAYIEGYIFDTGGRSLIDCGFLISRKKNLPSLDDYEIIESGLDKLTDENTLFKYSIDGLESASKYYIRFFAKNSIGVKYSDAIEFITIKEITVTTSDVSDITKRSALCGGTVSGESERIVARGVCWSNLPNPTVDNAVKTKPSGSGIGSFNSAITQLSPLTRYFVRAYATTNTSTTYGDEKQFTTAVDVQPDAPKVATLNPQVADTFVIGGVSILDEGTQGVVNKGIVVSLIPDPANLNDVVFHKEGNPDSPIQIDELEKDTDYYVIAYAENEIGFSFGEPLAIKTIGDLAAQPFSVDISLESMFVTKDIAGKTINKVTATLVCTEPNIKEYGIRWTTDYIWYIDPELNWMMASNKSTGKTIDIWDMPAAMPIYYYGYAITNSGVESRSVGKQINLPTQGGTVNPNDPPIVPPVIPTTGAFLPPANAVIGKDYLYNNKRWVKTSDGWERDYNYIAGNNALALAQVSGQKSIEIAQKAELFDVSDTKKMIAADKFVYSDLEQINYYVELYLTQNTVFTDGESIILRFGDKEITNITASRLIENGEPNEKIMFVALMATEIGGLVTRADDASLIENATDPIQIESVNNTNVGLVIPSSSRKVPMESIYGEENKLNRNWTLIRTEEELNSTVEDGFYGVNLTSGEYTPFGNSEFTLTVNQAIDSDWSSQIAVVYSYGKVRMFCRTLSSGVVGDAPMYGWEEIANVDSLTDISNKKWCIFGDSMSNDVSYDNTGDYPSYVLTKTKMTGAAVNAVAGNTITQQLDILNGLILDNSDYLLDYDIVSLHVGINDFTYGTTLGNALDVTDADTYSGKLKKFIEVVLTSNPNVDLYIMTPMEANGNGVVYGATNTSGWTVKDMSKIISKICSLYSVKCIDLYNKSQFNLQTIAEYTYDGLHPDGIGCEKIADIVSSAFKLRTGDSIHYKDIDYNVPITIFEKFQQPTIDTVEGWFNDDINLGYANLSYGIYNTINLSDELPKRCYLGFSILCSSDFSSSTLDNAYFNYANMDNITAINASFINTDMTGAKISFANLNGATFLGAIMTGVLLRYSSLVGCNFTGANMTSVDFLNANIDQCNFTNATGLNASINVALLNAYKNTNTTVTWTDGLLYEYDGTEFILSV